MAAISTKSQSSRITLIKIEIPEILQPVTVTNAKNKSFIERYAALVFIVAFALIGGIIALVVTNAAANAGAIVSKVTANKCLDNSGDRKTNGNKIQLYNCNNTSAQKWVITSSGAIMNANGYCLDIPGASKSAKVAVQLHACNNSAAQKWSVKANGNIVNTHSGLCLEDKYASIENGNEIWMLPCSNSKAQKWAVPLVANTT